MSSLLAIVRKERVSYASDVLGEASIRQIVAWLRENSPTLVNITDHARAWENHPEHRFDMNVMDATPPFKWMWLEWLTGNLRSAAIICRTAVSAGIFERGQGLETAFPEGAPTNARFILRVVFLNDQGGYARFHSTVIFCIDHLGCVAGALNLSAGTAKGRVIVSNYVALICEALTNMNTHGTRIEPPFDSQPTQIVKPDRAPCSVWHTIHLPRFAAPPLIDAEITPEILERREHWVRGHRKDFRRGAGMFGRVKALVWVGEHQRGNPELGSVFSTYQVEKHKEAESAA